MFKTTREVFIDELGFPPQLAAAFCYPWGNIGRTPANSPFALHAVEFIHYRHGAYFPKGGAGHFAECIIPIVEVAGGQVAVRSKVKRIVVEKNRAVGVELDDGRTIRSKRIISDTGAYSTFMKLLPPEVSERHGYPRIFQDVGPSSTHLYLLLGYDEAIELPGHIIWDLPSYDIEGDDARFRAEEDLDLLTCYMLCPSTRDSAHGQRYPDKSTVMVLAEAPNKWFDRYQSDPEYQQQLRTQLQENLLARVQRRIPVLRDKTPAIIRCGMPIGCNPVAWNSCSYGLEPTVDRFVKHNHELRPKTRVKGLWLTGQDAFAPGICGAMMGARFCYAAMTHNWPFMARKTIGRFP